jgi:hypothetical protein
MATGIGPPDHANNPNAMNHTGMIAVRLNKLDMVIPSSF